MATPNIEGFYLTFGRRLCALREQKELTQEQLGRLLPKPVTRAAIANIETGKQRVLAHMLVDLARALDVHVTELLPRTEAVEPRRDVTEQLLARRIPKSVAEALAKRAAAKPEP